MDAVTLAKTNETEIALSLNMHCESWIPTQRHITALQGIFERSVWLMHFGPDGLAAVRLLQK
jgi:hypothetical protein